MFPIFQRWQRIIYFHLNLITRADIGYFTHLCGRRANTNQAKPTAPCGGGCCCCFAIDCFQLIFIWYALALRPAVSAREITFAYRIEASMNLLLALARNTSNHLWILSENMEKFDRNIINNGENDASTNRWIFLSLWFFQLNCRQSFNKMKIRIWSNELCGLMASL